MGNVNSQHRVKKKKRYLPTLVGPHWENRALGLEYGPQKAASGRTRDLGADFPNTDFPVGKITYMCYIQDKSLCDE